ncbi:DNA repair protein Rev1 [Anopheles bellator]|uniref:DNA repair protein Rev1 n=1 Tax=Anopheles bellator TaxID=139047 RepID=UPI002648142E|nr:DNA repair protein Rev1 [Anopheles bellator]
MQRKQKYESETGFEGWGDYMDAKIAKLEDQFRRSAANVTERQSDLFSGISIFVNGHTNPSAEELKRIMMLHGGIFHHYKRPTTTYTIASVLPDVKVRSITSEIIISPRWVIDCLQNGRIVDYKRYLLYTQHKPSQPKLVFATVGMATKTKEAGRTDDEARKNSNDASDISPRECLNVLGLLKNFTHSESVTFEKGHEVQSTEIILQPGLSGSQENRASQETESINQHQHDVLAQTTVKEVILSPPPKISVKQPLTATDPNFLAEFFNNSRLHHIATLGAGFKAYVAELREKSSGSFPARDVLSQNLPRIQDRDGFENLAVSRCILHIDMDCFFVSVGLRKHPHLRGLPVAVTHSRGSDARVPYQPGQNRALEIELYHKRFEERNKTPDIPKESRLSSIDDHNSLSEIASCSYEARRKGVKNGMFVGAALKICPELRTIPYDFEGYKEVAYQFYDTIIKYTLDIEAVSCDEMFVDLSEVVQSIGISVMDFVTFVRNEISTTTGCACSAGIGSNRLLARMATKRAKPNGQYWLAPDKVESYMRDIPIGELPGVGPSTTARLKLMASASCADLQTISLNELQTKFGKKFGETLYNAARGIDERPLVYDKGRKSVSVDVNYGIRFSTEQEVDRFMRQLTAEIHRRLLDLRQRGKIVTVKLLVRSPEAPIETAKFMGHGLCDVVTKSQPLVQHTDDASVIESAVLGIMRAVAVQPKELRGIGIQISKFAKDRKTVDGMAGVRLKNMLQYAESKQKKLIGKPKQTGNDAIREEMKPHNQHDEQQQQPSTSWGWSGQQQMSLIHESFRTPKKESTTSGIVNILASPKRRDNTASPSRRHTITKPITRTCRGFPPAGPANEGLRKFFSNEVKSTTTVCGAFEQFPSGLDPEVLAALPEDIRNEAIRDFRRQLLLVSARKPGSAADMKTPIKQSPSIVPCLEDQKTRVEARKAPPNDEVEKQIKMQCDEKLVTCSDAEIDEPLWVTPEHSPLKELNQVTDEKEAEKRNLCENEQAENTKDSNIINRSDWLMLMEDWVASAEVPYEYDVELLAANGQELVQNKTLERLYLFLRCFCRLVQEKGSCVWHKAYSNIVHSIQHQMVIVYGSKLASREVTCDACNYCN